MSIVFVRTATESEIINFIDEVNRNLEVEDVVIGNITIPRGGLLIKRYNYNRKKQKWEYELHTNSTGDYIPWSNSNERLLELELKYK